MAELVVLAGMIVLVGMMGAGKTTVGRQVADRLGWPLVDTDEVVAARTGATPAQLFGERGEAAFRAEESAALDEVLRSVRTGAGPVVVATGGGVVVAEANRQALAAAVADPVCAAAVVWLRAAPGTLAARVGTGEGRPLLAGSPSAALTTLAAERAGLYEAVATAVVDVDDLAAEQAADRVLAAAGTSPGAA